MESNHNEGVSTMTRQDAPIRVLPNNFGRRLLFSVPLMFVAGFCLFGFFDTFEPMPRVAQLSWRAAYICVGLGSVFAICCLWLKARGQIEAR